MCKYIQFQFFCKSGKVLSHGFLKVMSIQLFVHKINNLCTQMAPVTGFLAQNGNIEHIILEMSTYFEKAI